MKTQCCIVGGGPAGMMLGYLLARAGLRVVVLEKHKDFFRDFRGDTVHPSTLEVLYELDLLEGFLDVPHEVVRSVGATYGNFKFDVANFSLLPTQCRYIALMPQWDFLNYLAEAGKKFSGFDLRMEHEGFDLIWDDERVTGVKARTPVGVEEIEADLIVSCDGRGSRMRELAQLEVSERGVPIDVLWFKISRKESDHAQSLGILNYGKALILINRQDYFQAGLIVQKGSFERIKEEGIANFQNALVQLNPEFRDRVAEIASFDQVKLLTVQINRLKIWSRPGFLCIGDAAHAMSPAGGVGINLAIQDAVATANLLGPLLKQGRVGNSDLGRLQRRRQLPTIVTQKIQELAHRAFQSIFRNQGELEAPAKLRFAVAVPGLPFVLGRVVGMGVLPEHVDSTKTGKQAKIRSRFIFVVATAFTIGIVTARLITRRRV